MPSVPGSLVPLVLLAAAAAWTQTLELAGRVEPELERGVATVSAVESPFYAEAPVRRGIFAFRRLAPGGYTLTVLDPEWGMTRKTVQVTPSFADASGRVKVTIALDRSGVARSQRLKRQGTVSVASLKVSPKARAAVRKAHARLGRGAVTEGVALLLRAVEISPSFTEAWNELGTIAYKAGRFEEAEERFRTALEHEPLAYAPMVNLGGTLLSQGRIEEALSFNLMARSMQPEDPLANTQLGMNFFYKGQFPKAREFLLRAKEADPAHFSYPQLFLAEIYGKEGKLRAARQELEQLLQLHPDASVAGLARDGIRQLDEAESRDPTSAAPIRSVR